MEKLPVTKAGYEAMEAELKKLKYEVRPQIITAIAEAREHGDLKENAEYHAAREQQGFNEGRIATLEAHVSRAHVVDVATMSGESVKFGATVTIVDEDTDEETTYQIVGELEADMEKKRLSITAPISRALINKSVGDSVEVTTPKGLKYYEILKVEYK